MVPIETMNALYALAIPFAVIGLCAQLSDRDHTFILIALIILISLSGALGLLQATGVDIRLYKISSENPGLLANRNHQGILLATLFPMLAAVSWLGGAWRMPRNLVSIVAGALAVIALPLVVVTGSRAGLVASLIAVVLLVPFIVLPAVEGGRKKGVLSTVSQLGIGAGVMGGLIWLTVAASRDVALTRLQSAGDEPRYPLWKSVADMLPTYMPWGSGIGSYVDVYQILEPSDLLQATYSNHAHNDWLEIALTAGVPGLLIVGWAIALFWFAAWGAFRARGASGVFARLGVGLILLIAIASTVDYPARTPIVASVLAIAAVWASSYKKLEIEDGRG